MIHKMTSSARYKKPKSIYGSSIVNPQPHPFASPPNLENTKQKSGYRFQYRRIGQALLLSEQNYIQVGIKTKVIYSYERDLRSLTCDLDSFKLLHLQEFQLMVIYSTAFVTALAIIKISCPFWGMVFPDVYLAALLAYLSATIPIQLVARISSEYHRRLSFTRVIEAELMRRKELDPNNRTSLPLLLAREPIS